MKEVDTKARTDLSPPKWFIKAKLRYCLERSCEFCGCKFIVWKKTEINRGKGRFCGRKCQADWIAINRPPAKNQKQAARSLVYVAVKTGKLKKPDFCEQCLERAIVQGHHEDYNKPLDVTWLCSKCHAREHA